MEITAAPVPDPAPVPAPKRSGPFRWILIGCGVITLLGVLGMGGCAGIFYFIYKGTDPIAAVGSAYLKQAPEIQAAAGSDLLVSRRAFGWNVQVVNDTGNARIEYDVRGSNHTLPAEAVVWLLKSGGEWTAVGARLKTPDGQTVTTGKPPSEHLRIKWDD